MNRPGHRERKKNRTRSNLIAVGLRLFEENGFDNTTTEHIARESDVSQRTLFRYFNTKGDLVLALHRAWQEDFARHLRLRPATETAWTSLVKAAEAALEELDSDQMAEQVRLGHLVAETPSLLAAFLRNDEYFQERLVELILGRQECDQAGKHGELRARLVVAAFSSAERVASQIWLEHGTALPQTRVEVQRQCTDSLISALSEIEPSH